MCRLAMLMLLMTFKTLTCGEMRALPHEEAGRSCHPNSIERTSVVSSPLGLSELSCLNGRRQGLAMTADVMPCENFT